MILNGAKDNDGLMLESVEELMIVKLMFKHHFFPPPKGIRTALSILDHILYEHIRSPEHLRHQNIHRALSNTQYGRYPNPNPNPRP